MAAPLIVRLLMDAAGYLKTVDTAVASNTKLEDSTLSLGQAAGVSADRQVAASLKATKALESQVAALRELSTSQTASAETQARAALLADAAQARLNHSLGATAAGTAGVSRGAQNAERDIGKMTRGALAGTGAISSMGRSLAFASGGFLAVAGVSTLLKESIDASLTLASTQRQVDAQLKTSGKSWTDYGSAIDAADQRESHISGFTNQELLQSFGYLVRVTGNVSEALKLNATAADVARGRHVSLSTAAIALSKELAGSKTALQRLGVEIPKTDTRMEALAFVSQKFAGQAEAGATSADRFHASLTDAEEVIGTALLPTFRRLTTELDDWLTKMTQSGRLQADVNRAMTDTGHVFHFVEGVIHGVNEVTGSFGNTLKLLLGIQIARWAAEFAGVLDRLAVKWGLVSAAAGTAAKAETAALGVGGLAVAGAGGAVAAEAGTVAKSRVILPAGVASAEEIAAVGGAAAIATSKVAALRSRLLGLAGKTFITTLVIDQIITHKSQLQSAAESAARHLGATNKSSQTDPGFFGFFEHPIRNFFYSPALHDAETAAAQKIADDFQQQITAAGVRAFRTGTIVPSVFSPRGFGPAVIQGRQAAGRPFGTAQPISVFKTFALTIPEQLAQAQAALTKTTKDDVANARSIIARIRRLIDQGHLAGKSLIQALQQEAASEGVIASARQQAAQQAAAIAAAKKAAASSYTTPIDLQLAEARAQLTASSADDIADEKKILADAKAAVASGKKNKEGQLAALQVELQAQQAIQSLTSQNSTTFTLPLKLQLALARAQAFGGDQTSILEKMKAALLKAYRAAKGNVEKQIDILNQISGINSQLESSAQAAFGNYKQASLAAETAGLGLSRAQRKALEARLSQRGPSGTIPGSGVGAGGFIIGADGRPVQVHQHRRPTQGRSTAGTSAGRPKLQATFNIHVYLDGRDVTKSVTIRQQKDRVRNPPQRRGPHAGQQVA